MSKVIRDYFVFALLRFVIGPAKIAPLSQSIRFKTLIKRDLVTRVLPRFKQIACFHFQFSLAPRYVFLHMIGC